MISILSGYFIGIIVSWLIFRPTKSFDEGYESAKKFYSDWDEGFNSGWTAGKMRFSDYESGFRDGWKAAKKQINEDKKGVDVV